jgi:hypothetical protein
MIAAPMIVAFKASCRIWAVPKAAILAKKVVVAFAHVLLPCSLCDAIALATASCWYQLIMTIAQGAGAQIACSAIIRGMALAFTSGEVTDAPDFVRSPMKLVVGDIVSCRAQIALNLIVDFQHFVVCIPLASHVLAFDRSVVVSSLALDGVAHELRGS